MKTATAWLLIFVGIIVASAAFLLSWLVSTGMTARNAPGPLETRLGHLVRSLATPRSAREMKNPMTATPENLVEARRHFADHCASCHANDGSGKTEMGRKLYPRAPDMRLPETQSLTDGELYYIIENGVRFTGMPAWGEGGENDHDTWHLVLFIRHLPHLTEEDKLDMENSNPRSPAEMKEEQEEQNFLNEEPAKAGGSKPAGQIH
jgi:mono/diheme cytochrome c family protein